MFYKIYEGAFLSRLGIEWRCELWRDMESAPTEVGALTFEADEPLVISWDETSKEDVICSSSATLKIESPGDRTYIDFYSVKVCSVRLEVYREGTLYWTGTLDTEFYEEPYERLNLYPVTLTFSDFGVLGRLKYNLAGVQTLSAILQDALDRCALGGLTVDYTSLQSTNFTDGTAATLDKLAVASDNFFDEDGAASTLEDVVTDMLRPLALRLTQRAGTVFVYDLNGLYTKGGQMAVEWDGDSQTLGVDKVVNNVKVTFSPYADSDVMNTEAKYADTAKATETNVDHSNFETYLVAGSKRRYFSFYPDYSDANVKDDPDNISFTLHLSPNGRGVTGLLSGLHYFKTVSQIGGQDSEGIAVTNYLGHSFFEVKDEASRPLIGLNPTARDAVSLFTAKRCYLPTLSETDAAGFYLRLQLDALIDPRYNPFDSKTDSNDNDAYEAIKEDFSFVFIPLTVTLFDSDGNALYYYDNYDAAVNTKNEIHFKPTLGKWVKGSETQRRCWLEWYDKDSNRRHETGICGWAKNRQTIGASREYLQKSFQNMDDGQYMPYPPTGGYLEVKVWEGLWPFWDLGWTTVTVNNTGTGVGHLLDGTTVTEYKSLPLGETFDESMARDSSHIQWLKRIRWYLLKAPVIDVVSALAGHEEAGADDIVYSGYLNKDAQEEISIDTTVGTASTVLPTAKGVLLKADGLSQIQQLERGGVTDHPERLYIGTLYSQFAYRHTKLSGEIRSAVSGLYAFTEGNQTGRLFLLTQEEQDAITDCGDATLVELSKDDYEGVEEVEEA